MEEENISNTVIENKPEQNLQTPARITPEAKRVVLSFFIGSAIIIGILLYFYLNTVQLEANKIYYFYTDECPNCKVVKSFMQDFSVEEYLTINKMDMDNSSNVKYMQRAAKLCKLPSSGLGVPLLFINNKCYIGRIEVIDYLNETLQEYLIQ